MKSAIVALAALATTAYAAPQGVYAKIPPPGGLAAGCSPDYDGTFQISVVKPPQKKRTPPSEGPAHTLTISLAGSVLKDQDGRTGYIADNRQFQFDGPPQTGAIYTSGFSVCPNMSLALGPTTLFYQCQSGEFYNIYDRPAESACIPVEIQIIGDGIVPAPQPNENAAAGAPAPVTQIVDGQPQGGAPALPPVTQIADGQIQATAPATLPAVTQISDGQIQAPVPAPPAPAPAPPVYPPPAPAPAPTPTPAAPVTQIGDGQIQAPTPAPPVYTGAANPLAANNFFAVAAGAAAFALF